MLKKIIIGALALILAVAAGVIVFGGGSASAAEGDEPCVPSDAWTETIEHPAVTHVVHHEAVTHVVHHDAVTHTVHIIDVEATPEVWANFSPNHNQGPFDGPPSYPTDERGTWHNHDKIPGGHEGADGVYQRDNPHSGRADWFYRHNATLEVSHDEVVVDQQAYDETVVDQEAYDETVVDQEAYTETIEHPAVECPTDEPPTTEPPTIIVHVPCGVFLRPIADGHHIYIWEKCPPVVKHPNTPVVHKTPAPVPTVIDAGL